MLKGNKYVENVSFKKIYPNTIDLIINEVNAYYYMYNSDNYYVFDKDAKLIDISEGKKDIQLIEIIGVSLPDDIKDGQILFDDDSRELRWIRNLSELLSLNKSSIKFDYVNLSNVHSVIMGYNNIQIKIGSNSDLRDKLNLAINIINSNEKFKNMKGYIDVRAKDYPVILLE